MTVLHDLEASHFGAEGEFQNILGVLPQQIGDALRRGILASQPEDLRWESVRQAAFTEIGIESDDYEVVVSRECPNCGIGCLIQFKQADMVGIWKKILEVAHQTIGHVLVEEELQR